MTIQIPLYLIAVLAFGCLGVGFIFGWLIGTSEINNLRERIMALQNRMDTISDLVVRALERPC